MTYSTTDTYNLSHATSGVREWFKPERTDRNQLRIRLPG